MIGCKHEGVIGARLPHYAMYIGARNENTAQQIADELERTQIKAEDVDFVVYDAETLELLHVAEIYKDEYRPQFQPRDPNGLLLNPKQRYYFNLTEWQYRSPLELLDWVDLPYVVGSGDSFNLFVLDGGSHDRPSHLGHFTSAADAAKHIELLR